MHAGRTRRPRPGPLERIGDSGVREGPPPPGARSAILPRVHRRITGWWCRRRDGFRGVWEAALWRRGRHPVALTMGLAATFALIAAPTPTAVALPDGTPGPDGAASAPPTPPPPPSGIAAEAWLLADAGGGAILAAHNAHVPGLPASTMKMLTALTVLPALPPDQPITVSDTAARVDGTRVGLVPGVRYTVRDLATAMLIASGNDATVALVEAAGGREAVLGQMNRLAASLGARATVAGDPTGLDAPGQVTTVHDLAVIGRAALNDPIVRGYLTIPRASLPGRGDERFEIANHNALIGSYEGAVGIKNGYTVAAGATFVGAATRGNRTLIVSLLRTAPAYATDARALLDWGFAHADAVRPVGRLAQPETAAQGRPQPGPVNAADGGPAPRAPAGTGGDAGALGRAAAQREDGVGAVTWAALAITIAATMLTLLGRVRGTDSNPRGGRGPRGAGQHGRGSRGAHSSRVARGSRAAHGSRGATGSGADAPERTRTAPGGGQAASPRSVRARRRRRAARAQRGRWLRAVEGTVTSRAGVPPAHAHPRGGAQGQAQRHLVGLPSLRPDPGRGSEPPARPAQPPFGVARSRGPHSSG